MSHVQSGSVDPNNSTPTISDVLQSSASPQQAVDQQPANGSQKKEEGQQTREEKLFLGKYKEDQVEDELRKKDSTISKKDQFNKDVVETVGLLAQQEHVITD